MKKLIVLFFHALLLASFAGPASAAPGYEEGTHYKAINPPQAGAEGNRVQIIEFFLYSCPHCDKLEPHLKKWQESKPDNVDFVRIPAMFKRPKLIMHAKTYYALELMGVAPEVHDSVFHAIHAKGNPLNTQSDMEKYLGNQGVNVEQYKKSMASFAVQANVRRAEKLLGRFDIRGVPAIIVDGKYLVSGMEGGLMVNVTNHVIDKVQKQKAAN